MAVITGRLGTVTFASGAAANWADTYANIFEWSLTLGNDEYESTNFGDTTNTSGKTFEHGLFQATGTLRAFMDKTTMAAITVHAPEAVASTLTLGIDAADSFAFSAQLFDVRMAVDRQTGLNVLDCRFESTGDLTETRA